MCGTLCAVWCATTMMMVKNCNDSWHSYSYRNMCLLPLGGFKEFACKIYIVLNCIFGCVCVCVCVCTCLRFMLYIYFFIQDDFNSSTTLQCVGTVKKKINTNSRIYFCKIKKKNTLWDHNIIGKGRKKTWDFLSVAVTIWV